MRRVHEKLVGSSVVETVVKVFEQIVKERRIYRALLLERVVLIQLHVHRVQERYVLPDRIRGLLINAAGQITIALNIRDEVVILLRHSVEIKVLNVLSKTRSHA